MAFMGLRAVAGLACGRVDVLDQFKNIRTLKGAVCKAAEAFAGATSQQVGYILVRKLLGFPTFPLLGR